jgi:hypothetical protein
VQFEIIELFRLDSPLFAKSTREMKRNATVKKCHRLFERDRFICFALPSILRLFYCSNETEFVCWKILKKIDFWSIASASQTTSERIAKSDSLVFSRRVQIVTNSTTKKRKRFFLMRKTVKI